MALMLITHDLGVVAEMAHRVAVMYAGEIVETAPREAFFARPAHPYSRKLFDSLPSRVKRGAALSVIRGSVPALTQKFTGCRFADRCDSAWDLCRRVVPEWHDAGGEQMARCHLFRDEGGGRRAEEKPSIQAIVTPHPSSQPDALHRVGRSPAWTHAGASSETPDSLPHPSDARPLLQVQDMKVHFPIHRGILKRVVAHVKAVDGVSLTIEAGKTLGLVGESGCGKTTVGKGILRLVEPTGGTVIFEGADLAQLAGGELKRRRKDVQIIFQDPYSSLNPRMRVMETLEEGMAALGIGTSRDGRQSRVDALLAEVGLDPEVKYRYPHEFSGGQRQRIAIARALSVEPRLIVCDEPTSALDVSVQAQILNLLKELQRRKGLAYLFITHNISVVEFLAHEVAVMYLGRIVEHGSVDEVLSDPRHPYTRALLSAVPVADPASRREVIRLQGDLPSPVNPPAGCYFHPRCPAVFAPCREAYPDSTRLAGTHTAACHLHAAGVGKR